MIVSNTDLKRISLLLGPLGMPEKLMKLVEFWYKTDTGRYLGL